MTRAAVCVENRLIIRENKFLWKLEVNGVGA